VLSTSDLLRFLEAQGNPVAYVTVAEGGVDE